MRQDLFSSSFIPMCKQEQNIGKQANHYLPFSCIPQNKHTCFLHLYFPKPLYTEQWSREQVLHTWVQEEYFSFKPPCITHGPYRLMTVLNKDATKKHAKLNREKSPGSQPCTKIYRQLNKSGCSKGNPPQERAH